MQSSEKGAYATFGMGTLVGEEWAFSKEFEGARNESCYSRDLSCVLEITKKQLNDVRQCMFEHDLKKDSQMLDQ